MGADKNRPSWRLRLASGLPKGYPSKFRGYQSRFGDGHPNRRQCHAIAKSTHQRCRCDALRGSDHCRLHGGHRQGLLAEQQRLGIGRVHSLVAGRHARRQALVELALTERLSPELPQPRSLVQRGRVLEAFANRLTAMAEWVAVTERFTRKR